MMKSQFSGIYRNESGEGKTMQESTGQLMNVLKSVEITEIESFSKDHIPKTPSFAAHMDEFIAANRSNRREIIRKADFPEKYGYKLLSGENRTSERDYILRFCIALGMNLKETQRTLELYGMRPLYPKDKRDMVLVVAINHGKDNVDEVNELLERHGCQPLKRSGSSGE